MINMDTFQKRIKDITDKMMKLKSGLHESRALLELAELEKDFVSAGKNIAASEVITIQLYQLRKLFYETKKYVGINELDINKLLSNIMSSIKRSHEISKETF